VEESNNLISLSIPIQGHGQARRMPVTRNAPFSLVFSAIRKENYQYVFRGKVRKLFKPVNSEAALVTMVCQSMPSRADNEAIQVQVHARYNMTAGTP
ncbi:hypothetical protein, partial [Paramuribaculum intestinale]